MSARFRNPAEGAERARAFAKTLERSASLTASVWRENERPDPERLQEALEIVGVQHEELVVAEEALREQVDELARALGTIQIERERYRELFEAAPDAYFVTDPAGVIRDANPRACALLGVDGRFVRGKPLTVYVPFPDAARLRDALDAMDRSPDALDLRIRMETRRHAEIDVRLRAVRLDGGRRILWIAREEEHEEATPHGDLARALRDKEELLAREVQKRLALEREAGAKDRFLAILSHDLRAPLNAVLGWTELLRKEILDQGRREQALGTIDRNARALLGLVEELLDISRIAADRMQLEVRPMDLGGLVRRLVEASHPKASELGIGLSCTVEPIVIAGDTKRIEQVVTNLLSNALRFTPRGGRVAVSVGRTGDYAVITVEDTGRGIPEGELPHVFDCFHQGQAGGRSSRKDGLGLGLYIVRQIALLHGGLVGVTSGGDGQGSTFTVEIPIAEHAPVARESSRAFEVERDLTGQRVLVVDDDEDARELIATLLASAGAQTAVSSNVADALRLIASWRPDVIVSDISLGTHDDGLEVARAARSELGDDVVLIAVSGFASDRDASRSLEAGFDAHVAKPFSAGQLVGAVVEARDARG